jgi:5-oxoprolinase (ATP-hydrolysing) subunit A
LRVAAEGFADRAYQPDGSLTPRSHTGAVIHDIDAVVARAVRMATDGVVLTGAGAEVSLNVNTICVHGDTPGASELVRRIHEALRERRVEIAPIGEWL